MRVRQVHGAAVAVGRHESGHLPDADILVACDPNLVIAVQAADCVPLLVADRRTGAVAAVHAGWRGLVARAPVTAVAELGAHCGSQPADLVVAVGPSIGACCYEVGSDVRARFADAGFVADELARWFLPSPAPSARNAPMHGLNRHSSGGRWYLDMWSVTRAQLLSAGVPPHQTFVAELCTASHPDTFCSYRRDGRATGRISGAIRPAPPPTARHRATAPRY
jgi:YfiH family protein